MQSHVPSSWDLLKDHRLKVTKPRTERKQSHCWCFCRFAPGARHAITLWCVQEVALVSRQRRGHHQKPVLFRLISYCTFRAMYMSEKLSSGAGKDMPSTFAYHFCEAWDVQPTSRHSISIKINYTRTSHLLNKYIKNLNVVHYKIVFKLPDTIWNFSLMSTLQSR